MRSSRMRSCDRYYFRVDLVIAPFLRSRHLLSHPLSQLVGPLLKIVIHLMLSSMPRGGLLSEKVDEAEKDLELARSLPR
jgi:hypothetical protein